MNLLEQQGEWCSIEFQDPQFGRRAGFVQTKFVQLNLAALEPLDLSVPVAAAAAGRANTARATGQSNCR